MLEKGFMSETSLTRLGMATSACGPDVHRASLARAPGDRRDRAVLRRSATGSGGDAPFANLHKSRDITKEVSVDKEQRSRYYSNTVSSRSKVVSTHTRLRAHLDTSPKNC